MLTKPIFSSMIRSKLFTRTYSTNLSCGVLLNRIPLISKLPSTFESSYWDYVNLKEENESLPFPVELYFKKGSLNERKWRERMDIINEGEKNSEVAVEGENNESDIFSNIYKSNSRLTESDVNNDIKSLTRALDQHLYLIINNNGQWTFPSTKINEEETLVQNAKKQLETTLGDNLDFWVVGKAPVGHVQNENDTQFLMKCHILQGQVELNQEFGWFTKQELQNKLTPEYFEKVKDLLS